LDFTAKGGKRQGRAVPLSLWVKPGAKHAVWKTQSPIALVLLIEKSKICFIGYGAKGLVGLDEHTGGRDVTSKRPVPFPAIVSGYQRPFGWKIHLLLTLITKSEHARRDVAKNINF